MEYNGIDVSESQGEINWGSVPSDNVKFVMIRATYGPNGIDSQFVNNITAVLQTNISPGAYHEMQARTVEEVRREAEHFLNVVRPYKFSYPLSVNINGDLAVELGRDRLSELIKEFLNTIRQASYYPMLYTKFEWVNSYLDFEKISRVDIWLSDLNASYPGRPRYIQNVTMWQYSKTGSVPGINGNVNLDVSYMDYPSMIARRGMNQARMTNGEAQPRMNGAVANGSTMEPDFSEPLFYTVEKGDTLRGIAKKVFGDPEQYMKIMELNNLTRPIIFAGQTLRIPPNEESGISLYRVKADDTLWKIAQRFLGYGPRYNEIMSLNKLTSDMVYPGQILKIPGNEVPRQPEYTVQEGDTLWKIAQNNLGNGNRYNEIMALNNMRSGNLRIGQVLRLPPSQ